MLGYHWSLERFPFFWWKPIWYTDADLRRADDPVERWQVFSIIGYGLMLTIWRK